TAAARVAGREDSGDVRSQERRGARCRGARHLARGRSVHYEAVRGGRAAGAGRDLASVGLTRGVHAARLGGAALRRHEAGDVTHRAKVVDLELLDRESEAELL